MISHEAIARSGATSIPEILRLAPNLMVAQTSSSQYVVTARGFSGNSNSQNFSNKLLVLIDGRSVYTPLYSGVYWDMQDVLPADIDRIEVISGPGATLWGANAVNGVINIVTRAAGQTQGGLLQVSEGEDRQRSATLRYGGHLGDDIAWRAYARSTQGANYPTSTDTPRRMTTGRSPSSASAPTGRPRPPTASPCKATPMRAPKLRARGPTTTSRGAISSPAGTTRSAGSAPLQDAGLFRPHQAQRPYRDATADAGYAFDTYDFEMQHSFSLGSRNDVVWGGGLRANRYRIANAQALLFDPAARTLSLSDIFAQDSFALTNAIKLIVGLKIEDDPYIGATALPSARLAWKPTQGLLVWAAASRAIRSPTPFDRDLEEKLGAIDFLNGNKDFTSEKLDRLRARRPRPADARRVVFDLDLLQCV